MPFIYLQGALKKVKEKYKAMELFGKLVQKAHECDIAGLFKIADRIDFRLAQTTVQVDPAKEQPLNLNQSRQQIPQGGSLTVTLKGPEFNMHPNDPPKLIQVADSNNNTKQIIVLHGTDDGHLNFGDDPANMQQGTVDEFNKWREQKGWQNYPWIACHDNFARASSGGGADALINASGKVAVWSQKNSTGDTTLGFQEV